jgi:eukaryotic-like serine/threonine-protein kinase
VVCVNERQLWYDVPVMSEDRRRTFQHQWTVMGLGALPPKPLDATITALELTPTIAAGPASDTSASHVLPRISIAFSAGKPAHVARHDEGADLQIRGTLGEGGMGRVHLARQRSLGRDVALKVVKHEVDDPHVASALLEEARIAGGLEHPGIVPVHALGLDDAGRPVLVMKRIEGVEWRELLEDAEHPAWARLEWFEGDRLAAHLEILAGVCNALHFAHAHGVLHRDVKPENVMVGYYGEIYLVDWGIAFRFRDGVPGPIVGTPAYMAPEMIVPPDDGLDERTDVYLLGATLHHVLTGSPRHEGSTLQEMMCNAYLSLPFEYGPEVPEELAELCRRATAMDRDDRPASALAFRQAIRNFLRHRGSIDLARTAQERLDEAREILSDGDDASVARLFAEARFGFLQALREWSRNEPARRGLEALLHTEVEHALARDNAQVARERLSQMVDPPAALRQAVEALEARVRSERERLARLEAMEYDLDVRVGARQRAWIAGVMLLVSSGIAYAVLGRDTTVFEPWDLVGMAAGIATIFGVMGVVARRHILANEAGRRVTHLIVLCCVGMLVHRVASAVHGHPVPAILTADLWMFTGIVAAMTVLFDRRFAAVAVIYVVDAVLVTLRPELAVAGFSLGSVAAFVVITFIFMRVQRAPDR